MWYVYPTAPLALWLACLSCSSCASCHTAAAARPSAPSMSSACAPSLTPAMNSTESVPFSTASSDGAKSHMITSSFVASGPCTISARNSLARNAFGSFTSTRVPTAETSPGFST
eukprot:CAMPEP_0181511446 /NCGR_PEP_ID=MMETSP1110-20121109/61434_1 /TAXON_ID=174948 /ORGANISM="Symbiodinium sp., Strain CCMP421" /LENGTH=113 /DNA_ID=CAMNT_0023641175 /DNA_START=9 /DNA_END=350 /DNA_ORIENTATION=-